MNVEETNHLLSEGKIDTPGLFPNFEELRNQPVQFDWDFGLPVLPAEPGLISIRGARQTGKSTWLEWMLRKSIEEHGPGSAFFLNGDFIRSTDQLTSEIQDILRRFPPTAKVCRLFIDEITAIDNWEKTIKRLYDAGETRQILILTTGSKASDLRHGTERLPGRKGRFDRTEFIFTQISYAEFESKTDSHFGEKTLFAYLLTGGSPLAANALIQHGKLPEYVIMLIRDWVFGECTAHDRSRPLLMWLSEALLKRGGHPVSLTRLAREAGVANNSVLQGYLDLLGDLLCVSTCQPVDANTLRPIPRKERKFHWINLLAAIAFSPNQIRTPQEFCQQKPEEMGRWFEWAVAQEIWRRSAIRGDPMPELQYFWSDGIHELDFFCGDKEWIEVKYGQARPIEFDWFLDRFRSAKLTVITSTPFDSHRIKGIQLADFLRNKD